MADMNIYTNIDEFDGISCERLCPSRVSIGW